MTTETLKSQLTQKILIKSRYVFTVNSMNKKFDNVILVAICNTQAYDSYFNKINHFSLTFQFLTPKERDLHCSHVSSYALNNVHLL